MSRVRRFVARWDLPFAVVTVVLYFLALPLVWLLFPDIGNVWISLLILFTGFTASVSALAALLRDHDEHA